MGLRLTEQRTQPGTFLVGVGKPPARLDKVGFDFHLEKGAHVVGYYYHARGRFAGD